MLRFGKWPRKNAFQRLPNISFDGKNKFLRGDKNTVKAKKGSTLTIGHNIWHIFKFISIMSLFYYLQKALHSFLILIQSFLCNINSSIIFYDKIDAQTVTKCIEYWNSVRSNSCSILLCIYIHGIYWLNACSH